MLTDHQSQKHRTTLYSRPRICCGAMDREGNAPSRLCVQDSAPSLGPALLTQPSVNQDFPSFHMPWAGIEPTHRVLQTRMRTSYITLAKWSWRDSNPHSADFKSAASTNWATRPNKQLSVVEKLHCSIRVINDHISPRIGTNALSHLELFNGLPVDFWLIFSFMSRIPPISTAVTIDPLGCLRGIDPPSHVPQTCALPLSYRQH